MSNEIRFAFYWRTSPKDKLEPENSREYQLEASLKRIKGPGKTFGEYGNTRSGSDWNRSDFQRLLDDAWSKREAAQEDSAKTYARVRP